MKKLISGRTNWLLENKVLYIDMSHIYEIENISIVLAEIYNTIQSSLNHPVHAIVNFTHSRLSDELTRMLMTSVERNGIYVQHSIIFGMSSKDRMIVEKLQPLVKRNFTMVDTMVEALTILEELGCWE